MSGVRIPASLSIANCFMSIAASSQKLNQNLVQDILPVYKPNSLVVKKIADLIDRHDSFLLTTHIQSDADGIGSEVALYHLLKKLKKKCWILNNEAPSDFLLGDIDPKVIQTVSEYEDNWSLLVEKIKKNFVFILDSSELSRSGKVAQAFTEANCEWASIDHHVLPSKKNYCVDSSYAATCELVWDMYRHFDVDIPKPAAVALYIGIVADSGNFRYNKTSFRTHLAGAHLLSCGVETDHIYRVLYENFPIDRLHLLKKVFKSITIDKELGYVIGEVLPKMKRGLTLGNSSTEGIVNMLLGVRDVNIAALVIKTQEGHLKGSLRSIKNIDVAKIAKKFGGGGHRNAAGLKIEENYRSARKKLTAAIHLHLAKLVGEKL